MRKNKLLCKVLALTLSASFALSSASPSLAMTVFAEDNTEQASAEESIPEPAASEEDSSSDAASESGNAASEEDSSSDVASESGNETSSAAEDKNDENSADSASSADSAASDHSASSASDGSSSDNESTDRSNTGVSERGDQDKNGAHDNFFEGADDGSSDADQDKTEPEKDADADTANGAKANSFEDDSTEALTKDTDASTEVSKEASTKDDAAADDSRQDTDINLEENKDGVDVKAVCSAGTFSEDTDVSELQLHVDKLSLDQDKKLAIEESIQEEENDNSLTVNNAYGADIYFTAGNSDDHVQPEKGQSVKVSIKFEDENIQEGNYTYFILHDDDELDVIDSDFEDGWHVFEASSFSDYYAAEVKSAAYTDRDVEKLKGEIDSFEFTADDLEDSNDKDSAFMRDKELFNTKHEIIYARGSGEEDAWSEYQHFAHALSKDDLSKFEEEVGKDKIQKLTALHYLFTADELPITSGTFDKDEVSDGEKLYSIKDDTRQHFGVTVSDAYFGSGDLTLTAKLTDHSLGLAFAGNLADDLNAQKGLSGAQISDNDKTVQFKLSGQLKEQVLTSLGTVYVPITDAQAENVFQNGYKSAQVIFTLKNADGYIIARNDDYLLKPASYTDISKIKIRHNETNSTTWENDKDHNTNGEWTIYADSFLDNDVWGDAYERYNLDQKDAMRVYLPIAGHDKTPLFKVNEIRIYAPKSADGTNPFRLAGISNRACYDGWPALQGPNFTDLNDGKTDFYFGSYFTSEDNYAIHNDKDGKGDYYLFVPAKGKTIYNNSIEKPSSDGTVNGYKMFWGYLNWKVKFGKYKTNDVNITTLEGNTDFTASNAVVSVTTDSKEELSESSDTTGMKFHTADAKLVDNFQYIPNEKYNKNGKEEKCAEFIPGAQYFNQVLMTLYNPYKNNGETSTDGSNEETYTFPYEIQPTAWHFQMGAYSSLEDNALDVTIQKADGQEIPVTYPAVSPGQSISFKQALEDAGEGARVSSVTVHWKSVRFEKTTGSFDYSITDKKENGDSFNEGDTLQIGYSGKCLKGLSEKEPKRWSNKTEGNDNYFYLRYGEKKCWWLVTEAKGYQKYNVQNLDDQEIVICPGVRLKGYGVNTSVDTIKHPVINLWMTTEQKSDVKGQDVPTSMISGKMTLTKHMAGWKFVYSVYDTETKKEREDKYNVPDNLTGDYQLTREVLGLGEHEYFTSLKAEYDGNYTVEPDEKNKYLDECNDPKGKYDISYLIKDIYCIKKSHGLKNGERVSTIPYDLSFGPGPKIRFYANLSHDGDCDRNHSSKPETGHDYGIWSDPSYMVFADYHYTIGEGEFSVPEATKSLMQDSTGEFTLDLPLSLRASGYHGYALLKGDSKDKIPDGYDPAFTPLDVPETLYVELTDDQFDVDYSNEAFQKSLAEHGMTKDDVSIVTVSGKKFLKMTTGSRIRKVSKVYTQGTVTNDNQFTIALKAWEGAKPGDHHPFGEVYYDISDLLTKYKEAGDSNGYTTEEFTNAVADALGLKQDHDTVTNRLFKADMSGVTVNVTRSTTTKVEEHPGLNDQILEGNSLDFWPDESEQVCGSTTVKAPKDELYNYTTITMLPRKGSTLSHKAIVDGHTKTAEVTNDYSIYLTGPVKTKRQNLSDNATVTYSYSKDGVNYVSAEQINAQGGGAVGASVKNAVRHVAAFVHAAPAMTKKTDDANAAKWAQYRYIKTVISVANMGDTIETIYPLSSDKKTSLGEQHAYVGGTWEYTDEENNAHKIVDGIMQDGDYCQHDYTIDGVTWRDDNENGIKDNGEQPAKDAALQVLSPDQNVKIDNYGDSNDKELAADAVIDQVSVDENGSFTGKTYLEDADQSVVVDLSKAAEQYAATKKTDKDLQEDGTDSDLERTSMRAALPAPAHQGIHNFGAGLIALPKVTANDVKVNVENGSDNIMASAVNYNASLPRPNHPSVQYKEPDDLLVSLDGNGNVSSLKKGTGVQTLSKCVYASDTLAGTKDAVDADTVYTKDLKAIVFATVSYDANGGKLGSGAMPTDDGEYYPSDDAATDLVNVQNADLSAARDGYKFYGWSENKNASYKDADSLIAPGTALHTGSRTSNIVLYAVYGPDKTSEDVPSDTPSNDSTVTPAPTDTPSGTHHHHHGGSGQSGTAASATGMAGSAAQQVQTTVPQAVASADRPVTGDQNTAALAASRTQNDAAGSKNGVRTGDDMNMYLWGGFSAAAAVLLAVWAVRRRSRSSSR